MSADDVKNSAKDLTKAELLKTQFICEIKMCLWSEALDVVTYYLTMMEDEEE